MKTLIILALIIMEIFFSANMTILLIFPRFFRCRVCSRNLKFNNQLHNHIKNGCHISKIYKVIEVFPLASFRNITSIKTNKLPVFKISVIFSFLFKNFFIISSTADLSMSIKAGYKFKIFH